MVDMNKIINFIKQQITWRPATLRELTALYIFKIVRQIALSLTSIFLFVFLYQKGYSVLNVAYFLMLYFFCHFVMAFLSSVLSAKFGAKRIILISNVFYVASMLVLVLIDKIGLTSAILGVILQAIGVNLFQVSYDILFSEIKNSQKSGQEISLMLVLEKVAGVIAPLIGGAIATYFGAESGMILSSLLLIMASVPLAKSQTVAKKHHRFELRGFPWRAFRANFLGQIGRGFFSVSDKIWVIYVLIYVVSDTNSYSVIGQLSAETALVSIITAFLIGKIIDIHKNRIKTIFYFGVILQSLIMLSHFWLTDVAWISVSNFLLGVSIMAYYIPFVKAQYDAADKSGSRVVYQMGLHTSCNFFSFLSSIVAILLLHGLSNEQLALRFFFLISGLIFPALLLSDFAMFRKKE